MFRGDWIPDNGYNKGDIVYIASTEKYYICSVEHTSTMLGFPSSEDMHWVLIDPEFRKKHSFNRRKSLTISSPFVSLELPDDISPEKKMHKRKIESIEEEINNYKRKKNNKEVESLHDQILLLNLDISTKSFLLDKYDNAQRMSGSDYSKNIAWLKTVLSIPFGILKDLEVKLNDPPNKIKQFFKNIKTKLDKNIHGLDDVKQEILEFVARKITNPNGKGHVLALCSSPGTGKTKIIKTLADALNMPFYQINCGGLNDAAALMGHSETYVGSKPGKIVEILQTSPCMNPIIYFDEIDKISESRALEINGILTHLLDEEQNNQFQDNYLSNINIDLSKAFFVLAFNDVSKIDSVVFDRLKVIYIDKPTIEDKILICKEKVIPELIESMSFNKDIVIELSKETIEYICTQKCNNETGVRHLKKQLEKVLNKLNYDILVEDETLKKITKEKDENVLYNITRKYVDNVLVDCNRNYEHLSMYT
jgi:ATP-dependent Lon protease